jgi:hypothetical protein
MLSVGMAGRVTCQAPVSVLQTIAEACRVALPVTIDCSNRRHVRPLPSRKLAASQICPQPPSDLSASLFLTGPVQYLPRCVLAATVFTIGVGMIDVADLHNTRRESPGKFNLAISTAAAVVAIGVEQGIVLAIALSLFRHVRQGSDGPDGSALWVPRCATGNRFALRRGKCSPCSRLRSKMPCDTGPK